MGEVVCFCEGKSDVAFLKNFIQPRLPNNIRLTPISFGGKGNLKSQLIETLKEWLEKDVFFLILIDKDDDDCRYLKEEIRAKVTDSRVPSKNVLIRIACTTLESFYLGDLDAVRAAYRIPRNITQDEENYRAPDMLTAPEKTLCKLLNTERAVKGKWAKKISPHMSTRNNRSRSFNTLIQGLEQLMGAPLNEENNAVPSSS